MITLRIEYDYDTESPCEWDGSWSVYRLGGRNGDDHEKIREVLEWTQDGWVMPLGLRNKLRAGTAFFLDKYEHGGVKWSIGGTGTQCCFDTSSGAGLIVWNNPVKHLGAKSYQDREKDASAFIECYTDWCNGNCYWYSIEKDGEGIGSCGGFIGDGNLTEDLKQYQAEIQGTVHVTGEVAWLADYISIDGVEFIAEKF